MTSACPHLSPEYVRRCTDALVRPCVAHSASLMARVREMTATPTPLSDLLQTPEFLNSYLKSSSRDSSRHRPTSSRSQSTKGGPIAE